MCAPARAWFRFRTRAAKLTLESGERVPYDQLVIATGARCDHAGIAGASLPHVFTLHTLDDAERMRRFVREQRPKRAVVVGAGYIGVEAADALRRNGLRVTVVGALAARACCARTTTSPPRWSAATGGARRGTAARHGDHSIEPDRAGDMPCDMVVLAAGFQPNVELAAQAGIEIGRSGAIAPTSAWRPTCAACSRRAIAPKSRTW